MALFKVEATLRQIGKRQPPLGPEGSLTAVPLHGLAGRLKFYILPEESCLSPKNRGCWGRALQHPPQAPTWCDL